MNGTPPNTSTALPANTILHEGGEKGLSDPIEVDGDDDIKPPSPKRLCVVQAHKESSLPPSVFVPNNPSAQKQQTLATYMAPSTQVSVRCDLDRYDSMLRRLDDSILDKVLPYHVEQSPDLSVDSDRLML